MIEFLIQTSEYLSNLYKRSTGSSELFDKLSKKIFNKNNNWYELIIEIDAIVQGHLNKKCSDLKEIIKIEAIELNNNEFKLEFFYKEKYMKDENMQDFISQLSSILGTDTAKAITDSTTNKLEMIGAGLDFIEKIERLNRDLSNSTNPICNSKSVLTKYIPLIEKGLIIPILGKPE